MKLWFKLLWYHAVARSIKTFFPWVWPPKWGCVLYAVKYGNALRLVFSHWRAYYMYNKISFRLNVKVLRLLNLSCWFLITCYCYREGSFDALSFLQATLRLMVKTIALISMLSLLKLTYSKPEVKGTLYTPILWIMQCCLTISWSSSMTSPNVGHMFFHTYQAFMFPLVKFLVLEMSF